jgi:hypothetical protein
MRKTFAAATMSAAILGGAAAGTFLFTPGLAGAQTDDSSSTTVVEETGQARPGRGAWVAETLAQLVTDGTITQEQADAVAAALEANRPEHGPGHEGRGERLRAAFDAAATSLGTTPEELRDALRDGSTIAELAAEAGVEVGSVVEDMVAAATTELQEKVAAGEIDQERADEILSTLTERLTDLVENGRPAGPRG